LNYSLETLKELIAAKLSPEEILDCLGWTTYELVDALSEYIQEYQEEFESVL
jgi:hypothetical protein